MDINADMGEGLPHVDAELVREITSANIACGGHAGDAATMGATVALALEAGVRIGAHPSYPDKENFGRVVIDMSPGRITEAVVEQVNALRQIAEKEGGVVEYFKPHGALYNFAAVDESAGEEVIRAAEHLAIPFMMLFGSRLSSAAPGRVIQEGFIDRRYRSDGTLVPRDEPGALISDPEDAARQAVSLAADVESLCVHSDTPNAVELVRAAREKLKSSGYVIGSHE